jgi:hypothetical protein
VSDLLNDSPTAVKFRDRILKELGATERILYVTDGEVKEPLGGNDFVLYSGAIIVTNERLVVVESKALGRCVLNQTIWRNVESSGRHDSGAIVIRKPGSRPIWKISIWEGKSYKTPLDKKRLDMLALAIEEVRLTVATERAAENADHDAQVRGEYEELKRRRGF